MPHRDLLLSQIKHHIPYDKLEQTQKLQTQLFIEQNPLCFYRSNFYGHITADCIVIDPKAKKMLLHYHKYMKIWLQFGGHCDGNADVFDSAVREFEEETGVSRDKVSMLPSIFDISVGYVPENKEKNEPEHIHYIVAYLCELESNIPIIPGEGESTQYKWVLWDEVTEYNTEEKFARWVEKIKAKYEV